MTRRLAVAFGTAVCLAASSAGAAVLAPAASAAEMKDQFEPYFDIQPEKVYASEGDFYSKPVFYELKGVPEGASWDFPDRLGSTYKGACMAEKNPVTGAFQAQLLSTSAAPLTAGVNTCLYDVKVKYPDGSSESIEVRPQLIPSDDMLYEPAYDTPTVNPGEEFVLEPVNRRPGPLPEDAAWSVQAPSGRGDWQVRIDEHTGVITARVPIHTARGNGFKVTTTFADGTTRQTTAMISNTGIGAQFIPEETPDVPESPAPGEPAGSTPLQALAIVFGVLAALGVVTALAWSYLPQF